MRWRKCDLRKAGIVVAGALLLLVLMTWVPLSVASAHQGTSGLATPGAVPIQTTPTEDATVTALSKEQLTQQVAGQQHTWDNWLWSNAATILSSFLSTLVIVIGALVGLWRWRRDQHTELEKRAEERFQAAVTGLGDEKEGARIGAAILLRTFLRPGYEQFYIQTFDLAVANLRLPRTPHPSGDLDADLPLTTLSQALIMAFVEAFPLARSQSKGSSQFLDASRIQLDNAFLNGVDLKQVWMRQASLQKAKLRGANLNGASLFETNLSRAKLRGANLSGSDLVRANLSGAELLETNLSRAKLHEAHLSGADLSGADLSEASLRGTNLEDALSLKNTDLRRVKGLTKEQLVICKSGGAIIDEETSASQPIAAPPLSLQSNHAQASSTLSTQGSLPPSNTEGSSTVSSQQEPKS